jgi:predicted ATP-grasp superfamily ATP-dependent carboligase
VTSSGEAGSLAEPCVLIAAVSGRALAAAARRAGYAPLVADLFGDRDTQALAAGFQRVPGSLARGPDRPALRAALARLAAGRAPVGLVYGSGFERRPALLRALAHHHRLLGNAPETVARLKDPFAFAELCRACAVPHPPVTLEAGEGEWLEKRAGGAGGSHVRPARRRRVRPPRYLQRKAAGRPVSALFLGDGAASHILGFSEQWAAPAPGEPYRYGGAARPAATAPHTAALAAAVERLSRAAGLVGLNSADFLLREDGFDLLEINPRPGATLDLFADTPALFAWHLEACRGRLPAPTPAPPGAAAAAVVYAPRDFTLAADFSWPDWAADRQPPGPVAGGAPFCTVLARAPDVSDTREQLQRRMMQILALTEAQR